MSLRDNKVSSLSRIYANLTAGSISQVVNIVVQFASVPLYMLNWGVEKYGFWLTLTALLAYLTLGDMGVGSVAGYKMVMAEASGKRKRGVIIYHSAVALSIVAALIVLVITAFVLLISIGNPASFYKYCTQFELILFFCALWTHVAIQFYNSLLGAAYRCTDKNYFLLNVSSAGKIVELISISLVLGVGGGIADVAMTITVVRLLVSCVSTLYLNSKAPWLRPGVSMASKRTARSLLRPALSFMAFPLGNAILNQGFILVIAKLLGPQAVAIFSTIRTLSRTGMQAANVVNAAIAPEISRAYGGNDRALLLRLYATVISANFLVSVSLLVCLSLAGVTVLAFWTRGQLTTDYLVMFMFSLTVVPAAVWQGASTLQTSTNRHETLAMIYLALAAMSLTISIPLVEAFGIRGAAIALILMDIGMLVYALRSGNRLLVIDAAGLIAALRSNISLLLRRLRRRVNMNCR